MADLKLQRHWSERGGMLEAIGESYLTPKQLNANQSSFWSHISKPKMQYHLFDVGLVPTAHCEDILARCGRCENIWKESLPCVADSSRLSYPGHFARLTLVSDDRSATQRPWGLCLSCTRHPAAAAFPLVFVHANIHGRTIPDACFPSLSLIAFQSRQPHRDAISLFPFSHGIYFVFSWRAISLSHHSITYAAKPRLWVILSWQGCPSQGQMRGNRWGWRCGWQCEHKQNHPYLHTAASAAPEGHAENSLAQIKVNRAKIIKGDGSDVMF